MTTPDQLLQSIRDDKENALWQKENLPFDETKAQNQVNLIYSEYLKRIRAFIDKHPGKTDEEIFTLLHEEQPDPDNPAEKLDAEVLQITLGLAYVPNVVSHEDIAKARTI